MLNIVDFTRRKFMTLFEIHLQIQVSHTEGFFLLAHFDNEILNKMTVWSFGAYKCTFLILMMIVPQEPVVLNHATQQTNCSVKRQYVLQHPKSCTKLSLTLPQLDPYMPCQTSSSITSLTCLIIYFQCICPQNAVLSVCWHAGFLCIIRFRKYEKWCRNRIKKKIYKWYKHITERCVITEIWSTLCRNPAA